MTAVHVLTAADLVIAGLALDMWRGDRYTGRHRRTRGRQLPAPATARTAAQVATR